MCTEMRSSVPGTHRVRARLALVMPAVILLVALSAMPGYAAIPFVRELADSTGRAGLYNSLALDARGNPHVSYYETDGGDLVYATRRGGVWTREVVDVTGDVGTNTSIALDSEGNPYISYHDVTNTALKVASRRGATWTLQTVDAAGNVGSYSSLALDAGGNAWISYTDGTNADLKVARWDGGSWSLTSVDTGGSVGSYPSLALDSAGNPIVLYVDNTNTALKLASYHAGQWTTEFVPTPGLNTLGRPALALDARDNPAICFKAGGVDEVYFGSRDGYDWAPLEYLDGYSNSGLSSFDLVLDTDGGPYVSYFDPIRREIQVAHRTGTTWTIEVAHRAGPFSSASATSIVLDSQGNPCISYYDGGSTFGDLWYLDSAVHVLSPSGGELWPAGSRQTVRWSGTGAVSIQLSDDGGASWNTLRSSVTINQVAITVPAWTTDSALLRVTRSAPTSTSVSAATFQIAPDLVSPWWSAVAAETGNVGTHTSLEMDAQDRPCISYYDQTNQDLKYSCRDGGAWTIETVASAGSVGQYSSLALDLAGDPHVSYYDQTNQDLKYASRSNGIWTAETVAATGNVGTYTSLALDGQGYPCISYYDATNLDLKYASKATGVWVIETVMSVGSVGEFNSLAIGADGTPRISFYEGVYGNLRYASRTGLGWSVQIVDAVDDVGLYTSLALDDQDNPRISYYANRPDGESGYLKFASLMNGLWVIETADASGDLGAYTSLALDAQGNPRISYFDSGNGDLRFAARNGGSWSTTTVSSIATEGSYTSLALDSQGNPRISFYDATNADLRYASAAIEVAEPAIGVVWPVGASREITWNGTGRVDLSLSVDGGNTWQLYETGLTGGSHRLTVPHMPSRFAAVKLERAVPRSVSRTPGRFTIETSIALLNLKATPGVEGGVLLTWETDPGPADLAGYTVERSPGGGAMWEVLARSIRETSYLDPRGSEGMRYRLTGVNRLGDELVLGEARLTPRAALSAWPLPYRGGELTVSFLTASGVGGGPAPAEVAIYDLRGRLVRELVAGTLPAGSHVATWDGLDLGGRRVASGIYFIRAVTPGASTRVKLVVVR